MHLPKPFSRLKGKLETPERGAATLTVTIRDFLIVTHAVPAERVRPFVPDGLPLDMLPGPDGQRLAFVQTTCFFNENFHWSPLPEETGMSFHQSTYRILTRREGRRGAYFLRTYLSTSSSQTAQRAIAREADYARFFVHITGDPVQGTYEQYTMRAVGERGQTALDVRALLPESAAVPSPFARFEEMALFLTQREEGYFAASAPPHRTGLLPVEHPPMQPVPGELVAARMTLWTELGLLAPDELLKPISVLIQPSVVFTGYPPRLTRLPPPRPSEGASQ